MIRGLLFTGTPVAVVLGTAALVAGTPFRARFVTLLLILYVDLDQLLLGLVDVNSDSVLDAPKLYSLIVTARDEQVGLTPASIDLTDDVGVAIQA